MTKITQKRQRIEEESRRNTDSRDKLNLPARANSSSQVELDSVKRQSRGESSFLLIQGISRATSETRWHLPNGESQREQEQSHGVILSGESDNEENRGDCQHP